MVELTFVSIFLGIDGGGSKTSCVIGNETSILGGGISGPSNVIRVAEPRARDAIVAAINQACAEAKVNPSQIERTCFGVAGGARPETAKLLQRILSEIIGGEIEIVGDMVIAMEAAAGSGPGVVVIAGTGSIAYGRNAAGQTARAGGWGFAISDEGSGHWIGREAVSAVLRARDEQQETALAPLILEAWKLDDMDALIQCANATPPPEFPRLLRVVLRAADAGDSVARELLIRAGTELGSLATSVLRRLAPASPYVPVAITGSVFRQSAEVRRVFYNQLEANFPGIELREDFVDPVVGALALARAAGRARSG